MRVVVIGGTGRIGSRLVALLRSQGHSVIAASRSMGVNVITGVGLTAAIAKTEVLIDTTDAPAVDEETALDFFTTSSQHLLATAEAANVQHYVALSVVGLDRSGEMGYLRGKRMQEFLIKTGRVPYTIVRATQFFSRTSSAMPTHRSSASNCGEIRCCLGPIPESDPARCGIGCDTSSPPTNGAPRLERRSHPCRFRPARGASP